MAKKRYINSIPIFILIFFISIYSCTEKDNPFSSPTGNYNSSVGDISQVDNYPLYVLKYNADYNFEEYLETGIMPFNSTEHSDDDEFQCTCVFASGDDNMFFGRNYDWNEHASYYLVFTDPPNGYSSISTVDLSFFTYYHNESPIYEGNQNTIRSLPYYPFDGMNEKGVVVGMNAVPSASSPHDPLKVTIGELQLIRLVLDYASSTEEAISLISQYNIRMEQPPIHYLISDSSGHSVAVEFVNGKMEVLETSTPWQVTTNFILTGNMTDHNAPCWRYKTAFNKLTETEGMLNGSDVESLMESVSVSTTRWTNIFSPKKGTLKIFLGRNFSNPHEYSLK